MKALIVKPVGNFQQVEMDIPAIKDNEVLMKVKYVGICGSDGMLWQQLWMPDPVLGHEFTGWIEDPGAFDFKKGDRVCIPENNPCMNCGYCNTGREHLCATSMADVPGVSKEGAFAEYVAVRGDMVRKLADNVSLELATLAEPVAVALHGVNRSKIPAGETLLVWGNGPIGAYTAYCAKKRGVSKVYMVGRGQNRVDKCNTFSYVDMCFSVKDPDFDKKLTDVTPDGGFGYVIDALGNSEDFNNIINRMRPDGNLVLLGLHTPDVIFNALTLLVKEINVYPGIFFTPKEFDEALVLMADDEEELLKTITSKIPLDADVMQAMFVKLFESGKNDDYKVLVDLDL